MKPWKLLPLFLALVLLMTACGAQTAGPAAVSATAEPAPAPLVGTVPGVDPATGAWIGRGGSYRFVLDEDAPDANAVLLRDGKLYYFTSEFSGQPYYYFRCEDETLYSLDGERANFELIGQSADGFWFHKTSFTDNWSDRTEMLVLLSPAGDVQKELDITACIPEGERGFLFGFGVYRDQPWVTTSEDELLLLDGNGTVTQRVPLPQSFLAPDLGGDGELYLVEDNGNEQAVSRLTDGAFSPAFTCPKGELSPGENGEPFLLMSNEGIDHVDSTGALTPIVVYNECSLSLTGLYRVLPLGDGRYYCRTMWSAGTLEPADPSTLHPRTRLTLGYLGGGSEWFVPNQNEVAAFNLRSQDYYIDLVDLSEGGAFTNEQALTRLNTALVNGTAPDMLSLYPWMGEMISPFVYSRQGLLVDMAQLTERDEELSLDDIVLAKALQNDAGGLYLMCGTMYIETYMADYARFGDRWGWTFDEYLDIDRSLGEGQMVFYNLTRDRFLETSAANYARSAIDWLNGTCDFNTEGFIALLNAAKKMRETPEPEDPEDMIFWDPNHLFDGTQVTEIVGVMNVGALASEQRLRNVEKLSFIGWPTPDGSCGSTFVLQSPFVIFNTSGNIPGCWEFTKYTLKHPASDYSLPVYRPLLEQRLAEAMRDASALPVGMYEFTEPLTEAEAAQFRELLGRVEHTNITDSTVLNVMKEECEPFFKGDKTAEQTAALIQSRLSMYVAEQS